MESERQVRRRRRPAYSCVQCRSRKIKCDRQSPCSHCVAAKITCVYRTFRDSPSISDPEARSGAQARQSRAGSTNSAVTSSPKSASLADAAALGGPVGSDLGLGDSPRCPLQPDESLRLPPIVVDHNGNTRWTHGSLSHRTQASSSVSVTSAPTSPHIPNPIQSGLLFKKSRIFRWTDWMGTAKEFQDIYAGLAEALGQGDGVQFQSPSAKPVLAELGDLYQRCKSMGKMTKAGRPSRGLVAPVLEPPLPPRDVADAMADSYFETFESTHRILHAPSFWIEYHRFWANPHHAPLALRLKILLVICLGSAVMPHHNTDSDFRKTIDQVVYAAEVWLAGPLEKDRLSITGIQINCLNIIAREFSLGGDLIWMSVGSLVHRAMQIGLHRDPKHLPPMSLLRAEVRRRLWATIVEMVIQSSLDSAMPPRIRLDDYDTEPPANVNDEELTEATMELRPRPRREYTDSFMQITLTACLPVRLRILHLLSRINQDVPYSEVLALSEELNDNCKWYSALLNGPGAPSTGVVHKNMLDFLVRRFHIPLHCPFATKARSNPLFLYSVKISLDTAMALMAPQPDRSFFRLMTMGSGLFKEGYRFALGVITTELVEKTSTQEREGSLHHHAKERALLKQVARDLQAIAEERVRQGETNIKGHLCLSMGLAMVEAMETGASAEVRELMMAQAGLDSIRLQYGIVEGRYNAMASQVIADANSLNERYHDVRPEAYGVDMNWDFFVPSTLGSEYPQFAYANQGLPMMPSSCYDDGGGGGMHARAS